MVLTSTRNEETPESEFIEEISPCHSENELVNFKDSGSSPNIAFGPLAMSVANIIQMARNVATAWAIVAASAAAAAD